MGGRRCHVLRFCKDSTHQPAVLPCSLQFSIPAIISHASPLLLALSPLHPFTWLTRKSSASWVGLNISQVMYLANHICTWNQNHRFTCFSIRVPCRHRTHHPVCPAWLLVGWTRGSLGVSITTDDTARGRFQYYQPCARALYKGFSLILCIWKAEVPLRVTE